jgi:apoptosis-inducing factor 3
VFSLARTTDLKPGEMRAFEVADKKVLVLRTSEGEWQAFNLECPHAGAPLDQGALCGDRIICPWHKSCFAAADGALLEPPSLASLSEYSLELVGDEVRIDPERPVQRNRAAQTKKTKSDKSFVVLGGGAAAAAAVQELRALGFAGRLVMVSKEQRTPYDRTLLSKMYLSGQAEPKQLPLRPETLLSDCKSSFWLVKSNPLIRQVGQSISRPTLAPSDMTVF